ncbi:S1C family serine protease [Shouchella sp. JSM 1781072]|uniref:S1C family serine protease n=1 Tax=Bacillaceae TaxID=186817 RepID=UPI001145F2D0|nr:serine protease [Bacillus sp. Marseille-P3800]
MSKDFYDYDEEPSLSDFEEEEPKKEKKWRKRIVRIVSIIIACALVFQTSSFLFEHFNLNALQFMRESEELFEDEEVEAWRESVVAVQTISGHGTGFFVDEDGSILTNEHVVNGQTNVRIITSDGDVFMADVEKHDVENDLALLIVSDHAETFSPLPLSESSATLHEAVIVIGHPHTHSFIANEGEVSDERNPYQVLTITNDVYPGHSGSPVLSRSGEVIGVIYARSLNEQREGLAVPIEQVQHFLDN